MGLGAGESAGGEGYQSPAGSVRLEQVIQAPADRVAEYISDFRNSGDWMVGVEDVEALGDDSYRVRLDTPVGKLEPGVRVTRRGEASISWVYTSTVEGGGEVEISPMPDGCNVLYSGNFRLKRKLLGRAARLAGVERFAHRNGERSLTRLKALMEAERY
ncbi:SRPBCC family protein [Rubrobacter aplysinae]|uniref:SRPBCC family protein n=1 Tax=Rubrobacter aplysinae TaxID=909625 RepID=UPI00064B8DAC|nr:SRPBCC family protein [Rubrobacter aplysinae]